jgi:hypothetical protein
VQGQVATTVEVNQALDGAGGEDIDVLVTQDVSG